MLELACIQRKPYVNTAVTLRQMIIINKYFAQKSETPYPTGNKHTISTLLIKPILIFTVLAHAEKQFFSKLVFEC